MLVVVLWLLLIAFCGASILGATLLIGYVVWRKMMLKDFNEKCVFITGSDKGFGRHLALELDRRGLTVYAGCHSQTGAENLKNEASKRLKTLVIEVTDKDSIFKARQFIENDLPPGKGRLFLKYFKNC